MPTSLFAFAPAEELLPAVLDLSGSGLVAYSPLLDEAGQLVDFAFAYLNPVAQRLLGLPAQPTTTYGQHFAGALSSGDFAFHRDAFLAGGEVLSLTSRHQSGAAAGSFQLAARRLKDILLVSLTPTELGQHAVEQALRECQAREQAALAATERERNLLQAMFAQAPVAIALLQGPELRITSCNERMGVLWSRPPAQVLGRPLLEALPELAGQGFETMLRQVLATGEFYVGTEVPATIQQGDQLVVRYYTFSCQVIHDALGQPLGLINVGTEVTGQVLARQQVEQLNAELEARVHERTRQLREQRQQLGQILAQVPAAIATLEGPGHRFAFANDIYRAIMGNRATVGQPVAEAQPELLAQGFIDLLDQVYRTGEPYLGREIPVRLHETATQQGQTRYVDFSYQPLRDEQGQITGILTFAVDETEKVLARRQADTLQAAMLAVTQRQVQERQNVYQLFEQLPAAIVLLREPAHRIDYFNPAFAELFPPAGWTGPLRGHPLAEVYPRIKLVRLQTLLDRVYRTGKSEVLREMPLADLQPGSSRYVTVAYQAYREHGRVAGVAAFVYDVTEQVLTRRQAEALQAELLAAAQRQARERAAQQAELQRIFEHAPVAICVYRGPDYVVEFVNSTLLAILGIDAAQMLHRPLAAYMPDMRRQGLQAALDGVRHTGQPFVAQEMPLTLAARPGREHGYFNFNYHRLPAAQGQLGGIVCVATEVTEQVRARQQVEQLNAELEARVQERELLYQIFAHTPAAICIQRGPAHRYEYVNAAYERFFPGRQFLGRGVAEVVPEAVEAGVVALLDQVYRTGETYYGYELPVLLNQPDGSQQWSYFTFTYQALRENGEVVGISTFAYDVAEQVLARREREVQQRLLASVFEQAPAGIWVVREPNFIFEVLNPAMARIIGRTPEQVLGRPYFEVLPELAGQGLSELLHRVWEQGEAALIEELPAQLDYHAPGAPGYFTFVFQPLRDERGQVARISCVSLDVTAQVRARQQVQHLNQQLTAANAELAQTNQQLARTNVDLDTFVYTASHDLKAPITNIEGLLTALREGLPAEVRSGELVHRLLELLQGSVERFQLTIEQLTDISRLHHAQNQPAERVSLAAMAASVCLDLEPQLTAAGAQLTVAIDPTLHVLFPPKNLRSVLYNLLSNAVKYRAADRVPVVNLRAIQQENAVVVEVQDNGLGLNAHQQERLFGLFQRLHTHVAGTGVGLYMVKRLVENAGGTIAVQSQLGIGSRFIVTLRS